MTDETRRRFLAVIAEHVMPERVAEVRVFRALRQGGVETGVAVVAADLEPTDDPADPRAVERHTVYTAHYRLVLKGPDRGRWEAAVTAEADAPLAAVETVVRGVLRRAGEDDDPEHLTGDAFRQELAAEPWTARQP
jgi:hypothetical protein